MRNLSMRSIKVFTASLLVTCPFKSLIMEKNSGIHHQSPRRATRCQVVITTGSSQPSRTIITQFPAKINDTYPDERHILLADSHHSDKRLDLPCTRAPSKTLYVYDTDGNQYELQSVATVGLYYALNTHCSVMSKRRFPDNRQDQSSHGQPPGRGIQ